MQAIITKFLSPTDRRGARLKASCSRGSITVPWPDSLSGDAAHRYAVDTLLARFRTEDIRAYGSATGWDWPYVTGSLPSGECVHVFVTTR